MIQINNAPDIKSESGVWLRSYRKDGVRYQTRGGVLWNSILTRCKPTGTGANNGFANFQAFMEWATKQFGYDLKDDSGFWHLDKDILVYGNRTYSEDTCLFVPQAVNKLVLENPLYRGEFPIGVSKAMSGRFRARCRHNGKEQHIGVFDCPELAHKAWVSYKQSVVEELLQRGDLAGHEKLNKALKAYMNKLEEIR